MPSPDPGIDQKKSEKFHMAKKAKKPQRVPYSKDDVKALKAHSRARTPVGRIAKEMKRTIPALRAKAHLLGIGLGENQR